MAHQDGRCATIQETIYVQNTGGCNDSVSFTDPGAGTQGQPLCSMQPVATLLSAIRDLVVVRGTVSAGHWTLTLEPSETSVVGQQNALVAGDGVKPAFNIQGGGTYIRDLEILSGGIGINATVGTVRLRHVTVDACLLGGILLDAAGFDIEDTAVTHNFVGTFKSSTTWGGILINNPPAGGPARLNLVTVEGNQGGGITCSSAVSDATGVFVSGTTMGVDIDSTCGFSSCSPASSTCGAQ
jgi:hypothetical protein